MTFTLEVEFFLDGAWVDVTRLDDVTYVMGPVTITRGRNRAGERMAPMQISFRMRDDNATLDGENPASPYWRKIAQGTPVRVSVDFDVRGTGEIASIDQVPGDTPTVSYVDIVVAGALRRLDMPQRPLRSAAYASFSAAENDATRIFYAPLEEEANATTFEVFQGRGTVSDTPETTLGGDTDSRSSARLVNIGSGGSIDCYPPFYSSLEHKVCMLWKFPSSGLDDGNVPVRLHLAGGDIDRIHLLFNTPWAMRLQALRGFSVVSATGPVDWTGYIDNNQEWFLGIELTQNGADVDTLVGIIREDGTFGIPTGTLSGVTMGRITQIHIEPEPSGTVGHVILGNDTGAFGNYISHVSNTANGANGYTSEFADTRMLRLLNAADFAFGVRQATLADAAEMGPQEPSQLGDLIYECVDADDGILLENRLFETTLEYVTRNALYNQPPRASLSWEKLTAPFKPTTNDTDLFNDFSVTRPGGTTGRYAIPDGDYYHRTTEQPPDGVGSRPGEKSLNIWPDSQVDNHAAWRAHEFSWREKRFDQVTVELAHPDITADERADIRSLDSGYVLAVDTTGAPAFVPYDELRLLVQGYTETITRFTHTLTFNTTPADVFEVTQVDAEGSYLAQPIDDDDTTFKIAPPSLGPAWSSEVTDLPYNIQIAGQPMKVTAVSEAVTGFISAGTVATGNNASLNPALPVGPIADSGDSHWLWATIRNSGTGTVDDIAGWTTIVDFGNTKLMARHYVAGDTAPTVTFTGGVANATTMAQIYAFSNVSLQLASGTKGTPAGHTVLNSSAQNIAYPAVTVNDRDEACVNMIFAWKQDDWTGVAPPSGFTEMGDSSTTTGDDAGIAAYYDLSGASADAGSLTVTGGASAISRAVVISVRPLQSITVTRGIASTPTGILAGGEVHAWRPGVNAL